MFSSPLSHARVSHTCTASVKPSLLRPTHRAKQNDPHRRTTIAISPVTGTAPIDVDRDRADRDRADRDLVIDASRDRDRVDLRRSRLSRSARLQLRSHRSRSHRENMLSFWVLFEFLGMNDIMCLFGS